MYKKPRKASTIALIRESEQNKKFEILMLLRSGSNAFLPCNYVFPGGAIEKDDSAESMDNHCPGLNRKDASFIIKDRDMHSNSIAFWIGAIRETFEETGILLASNSDGSPIDLQSTPLKSRYLRIREDLNKGEKSFSEIVRGNNLLLHTDRIRYLSRWVTPPMSKIRYDTRFFAAKLPQKQEVMHDGSEIIQHLWLTPQESLDRHKKGNLQMVLPTVSTLKELNRYSSIDDIFTADSADETREG